MRKPFSGTIFSALILLSIIILSFGCNKVPTDPSSTVVPSVVTYALISNVSQTTALSGGVITANQYGNITANGVCWSSVNAVPTIADSKTTDTLNNNGFNSTITGLAGNTTYYVRAYATNAAGTGYGSVVKFTTLSTPGVVTATVTTLAGSTAGTYGFADGAGTAALFNGPQGIAYNSIANNLYVSDILNNLIRTMTPAGQVTTLTQPTLGLVNGPLSSALFYSPSSVAFDTQGNAYVADIGNNVIRKITTTGTVTTLAGNGVYGYVDGAGTVAEFAAPQGIAVDAQGVVYVADRGNNLIREITPAGVVSTLAGGITAVGISQQSAPGYVDGVAGNVVVFNRPSSLALDHQGNLYVSDINNKTIRVVTISNGATSTLAGNSTQKNLLGAPNAVASDAAGNLFIADQSGRVLEITTQKVLYILAGALNTSGFTNGVGAAARFNNPEGIAVDAQGNIYVSDFGNNVIRKITVKVQ